MYYNTTIDTRDLEDEKAGLEERRDAEDQANPLSVFEAERLDDLAALADEIGGDWKYGVTLVPEDDFTEYAREYAEEIGAVLSHSNSWPATCIDWEQAARELAYDFTSVSFDGMDYLCRP